MTSDDPLSPATGRFVAYFGDLGQRWGLPAAGCRVHAYLYLSGAPVPEEKIRSALQMDDAALSEAVSFLLDYRMIERRGAAGLQTSGDPWEMLIRGLEQRRLRELPIALSTLRACEREAIAESRAEPGLAARIGSMLRLVEDLAAIDAQARRLPSGLVRGLVGASGKAARLFEQTFGNGRAR